MTHDLDPETPIRLHKFIPIWKYMDETYESAGIIISIWTNNRGIRKFPYGKKTCPEPKLELGCLWNGDSCNTSFGPEGSLDHLA